MMNLLLVCCLIGLVSSKPALQTRERDLLRQLIDILKKYDDTDISIPSKERKGIPLERKPSDDQGNLQSRDASPSCGHGNVGGNANNHVEAVNDNCVNAHNKVREYHKSPDVSWNGVLADGAAKWAKYLASEDKFEHSQNRDYGENLDWSLHPTGSVVHCANAVFLWYEEYKKYNYAAPGYSEDTGHFTQVVWKSSTVIGCGMATRVSNKYHGYTEHYIVCRYQPEGNVMGEFPENVMEPDPNFAPIKSVADL